MTVPEGAVIFSYPNNQHFKTVISQKKRSPKMMTARQIFYLNYLPK